ncbi:MAG: hypothetical protein ABIR30_06095 [Chitinophagaceae bacterium]
MRKLFFFVLTLIACDRLPAQKILLDQFKNMKPRNIGPSGMSGRIVAIDAVHKNPSIIYVGAASGGIWKTENGGADWKPIFDEQPLQNIGALAIQQSNPSVVWAGTGEGNPRNSLNIGEGIYKSLDAGRTWKRMGLEKTRNIHRVIIDPDNPNTVYVAAIGNPYAQHPERGVYKTTDGGESWNRILYSNDTTGCAELVMDPSNPNKLIASMWQHYRLPWRMKSGGPGSGMYITIDGGKNWKKLAKEDGMPDGSIGRIGIAFARSMPSRIYAKIEATKNGLYRSDDGGFKWQLVNINAADVTDRPFYYQEIYVDPKNENRIYDIHSTVTYSEDGGKTFSIMLPYFGIHPDHHAWWIHPEDPNLIIEGNDGGIGISRDRGKTWVFDEKIPAGQFYHINVDNEIPYNVMGGMQDNGSWLGPAYSWTNGGIRNYYWSNIGGGDGFDAMPDPDGGGWVYSMSQGGAVGRINYKTGERWNIRPPYLAMDEKNAYRFNWNAAIAQDPFDKNTIYYGSQHVHKSNNKGVSWETISPDLTTNDSAKIDQSSTGGLTLDITGAENHCTILAIEPSPKQNGVIWVGTDDGNVQLTTDGGKNWMNFRGRIPGMPVGCWIPQIRASRYHAGEVFVVANDYRRGDFKPYIFRSTDFGKTWTRLLDEKKVTGYALCLIQDPTEPNLIFAGTEQGLWISFDNGNTFQQWKNGYPSVSTYDLAIQEREADLAIATFGRALWILDDIRPLRKLAAGNGALSKKLTVFPAPDAYQAQYRAAPGYEWSVMGLWDAPNRARGAAVSYFLTAPPDTSSKKTRNDSLQVNIYNDKNEHIRNLKWKADSGFNRQYWGMEEKGVRQPGSPKPKPGAPEPASFAVLPGRYKIVLTLNKDSDSTFININDDPRTGNRNDIKLAQRKLYERLQKSGNKLTEGMDRLTDADEICSKMTNQLKDLEGKDADSLRKTTKLMQDSIKAIREFISSKPSDKQGINRDPGMTVLRTYQQAAQYIGSKNVTPGMQEEKLVVNAEIMISDAVQRINNFFAGKWAAYRQQVEGTKLNLFKDYKPIE